MRDLARNENGNVAIAFALSLAPMIGVAGLAVDYVRASEVRTVLQTAADAAALGSAASSKPSDSAVWLAQLKTKAADKFAETNLTNLSLNGEWLSSSEFRVDVKGEVPLTLLRIIPGLPDHFDVEVQSVVQVTKPKLVYKPPKVTDLDPEAADYNRIYVYCFDPEKKSDPMTQGRSQETAIADNAGTKYNYTMPACAAGETMSYRLHNVRNARTNPKQWDKKSVEHYDYYTDTVITGGVEAYDLGGYEILENVLCQNVKECVEKSKGGILPEGANRTPERSTQSCQAGKFMYYGWEDRPPGLGWTDRDYNDIRIVIECPSSESVGEHVVRLVQ